MFANWERKCGGVTMIMLDEVNRVDDYWDFGLLTG